MTSVGLGQKGSEAVDPVSSLCRTKLFFDSTDICQTFNGYHGTVGSETGFWGDRHGLES